MPRKKVVRTFKPYKSYPFRDYDPIIDSVALVLEESGQTQKAVHLTSGVSTTTISNWRRHKTKRPQFCTVNAVGRACGQELVWSKLRGNR